MIPSAVFVPAVSLQTKFYSPANLWEILGVCQRGLHMLCRPGESIRPGSSWKTFGSFAGVRCWQSLLLAVKSLYSCSDVRVHVGKVKPRPFTVGVGLRQGCVLSPLVFIVCTTWELDRQSHPSRRWCHRWELQDQPVPLCRRFGTASIFSTENPAWTRSVFSCVRPSRDENQR